MTRHYEDLTRRRNASNTDLLNEQTGYPYD